MSENMNGLMGIPTIKTEPIDPLMDTPDMVPVSGHVMPKEFLAANGLFHEDSDCEDMTFFTQVEVDNTRKCLENTRLIIKDFETQLDWHLQQYMTLRNIFNAKRSISKNPQERASESSKRQDLLSISQLSAMIANHPEGNKNFIKRKGPITNGAGNKKRKKSSDSEGDTDFTDEDSDDYDEEMESESVDNPAAKKVPKAKKKPTRGKKLVVPKDEIEEEIHELVVPKEERESDDGELEFGEMEPIPKITPVKRGRKPKATTSGESSTKRTPKAKNNQKKSETIDLTDLNRLERRSGDPIEIKDEGIDKDELQMLLQPKLIHTIEAFPLDSKKPIVLLKQDNFANFDFNECLVSNVVIIFEEKEILPEIVFHKEVANRILNNLIKIVHSSVFDQLPNKPK